MLHNQLSRCISVGNPLSMTNSDLHDEILQIVDFVHSVVIYGVSGRNEFSTFVPISQSEG